MSQDKPNLRSMWKGAIQFGMVNIPVKLYKATDSHKSHLHEGCPTCGKRLSWIKRCQSCDKVVEWKDIQPVYQVTKETLVKVSKQELEQIESKLGRIIPITDFVDANLIDEIAKNEHYFAGPNLDTKGSETPFFLFQQALADMGKVAIGKIVLRNKEHLAMISPYENGILITTLHWLNELRMTSQVSSLNAPRVIDTTALELGKKFIELSTKQNINLGTYKDEFTEKLEVIVAKKLQAPTEVIVLPASPNLTPTVDLVAALKASLNKKEKIEMKN